MLFCEPLFLFVFLPIVMGLYLAVPARRQNLVLTLASLAFYAAGEWRFLPWLVGSIAVNYWIAIGIDRTRGQPWAFRLLTVGIVSDLILLAVFKYAGFLVSNVNGLGGMLGLHARLRDPGIVLPLGISFFTFHKISYKVDVYRHTAEVRRKPLDLALYILLFPQLIAGPIVRYHEIADALVRRTLSRPGVAEGVRRFILGLGKKMIIANRAAGGADQIFALSGVHLNAGLAWLGAVCYAVQIYFDFSGYSDMAIGLAKMFGFDFPENFDTPYAARSVTEFWRRWHMSLSRWFRDYLYLPLGGNRGGRLRTYFNLVTVFFLCGLWHGASWTFVAWGLFHGAALVLERLGLLRWLSRLPARVQNAYALVVVLFGWVLFRADTLSQAGMFWGAMLGRGRGTGIQHRASQVLQVELVVALGLAVLGCLPVRAWARRAAEHLRDRLPPSRRWTVDAGWATIGTLGLFAIYGYSLMLIAAKTYNPFIYFRF